MKYLTILLLLAFVGKITSAPHPAHPPKLIYRMDDSEESDEAQDDDGSEEEDEEEFDLSFPAGPEVPQQSPESPYDYSYRREGGDHHPWKQQWGHNPDHHHRHHENNAHPLQKNFRQEEDSDEEDDDDFRDDVVESDIQYSQTGPYTPQQGSNSFRSSPNHPAWWNKHQGRSSSVVVRSPTKNVRPIRVKSPKEYNRVVVPMSPYYGGDRRVSQMYYRPQVYERPQMYERPHYRPQHGRYPYQQYQQQYYQVIPVRRNQYNYNQGGYTVVGVPAKQYYGNVRPHRQGRNQNNHHENKSTGSIWL